MLASLDPTGNSPQRHDARSKARLQIRYLVQPALEPVAEGTLPLEILWFIRNFMDQSCRTTLSRESSTCRPPW
jgi:hypothetical protein